MEFSKQECWNGLPFPTPGALHNPGIDPASPALAGRFFTTVSPGSQGEISLIFLFSESFYKIGISVTESLYCTEVTNTTSQDFDSTILH